jgi:cyclin-dependent kinase 10
MDHYTCRPVTCFEKLNKIGEGTYGTVCERFESLPCLISDCSLRAAVRARDKASGEIVALKELRMDKEKAGVC